MKTDSKFHASRIALHIPLAALFALCLSVGALAQNGPQAAAQPATHSPEDKDQLALVRLRAQVAELQLQIRQADEFSKAARERGTKAQAEFTALLESTVAKAPPASKGHHWEPADDGRGGYVLVEREDPTVTTAAATAPTGQAPQTAQAPRKPVSNQ